MDAAAALAAIAAAYADPDAVADRLAAEGVRVIRTIGSDAPFTWLRAAGFAPVRLAAAEGPATPIADAVMGPATGRRRAHRLVERLLAADRLDEAVLITRADAEQAQIFAALRERRRLGETAPAHFHLLDLLHHDRPASHRYNAARLAQLDAWLIALGGRAPTDAALAQAAAEDEAARTLLRALGERQLRGSDRLRIIGASTILPPAELTRLLAALDALPEIASGRRVFVTGSAPESDASYRALEADGDTIVGDDHEWGDRRLLAAAPATRAAAAAPGLAPLAARRPTADAEPIVARAAACGAAAIVHLTIDADEAAAWTAPAIARALPDGMTLTLRTIDGPAAADPAPARPAAAPPPRSRKSLAALAGFGAYQRDWFAELRERVAAGAPFAMVNANAPQEILRALDVPFVVNQWWASIVAAKQQTQRYRMLLRDAGYPTDVEAYSAQGLAAAMDAEGVWGGLPRPDSLHAVGSSDATIGIFDAWAGRTGARAFLYERTVDPRLDIETRWWEVLPDHWDEALEPERIDLLVSELRDVIAALEATTGRVFDEARFVAVLDLVNEQEDYYRRTRDLVARSVPAPISIVDSMPATMVPQWHRGTVWARDAARAFYDEVAARVAAGAAAVPNERVRLMWVGRGLWSETAFYQRWEESHGAVFVWSMYLALAADGYIRRFDRGRDPMRALAARFLTMGDELRMPSWAGPWHVHEAQSHQVDGAVALADADPFVLRALAAAGIPVLELGIDNFAMDAATADALDRRITAFIEGPATRCADLRRCGATA
ncbi:2-hydroxyacyl-CoA dehydratase family protein [Sphingomonas sp. CV7422]|uniref:2-hydroxyacyl-CoA dehydratase family protein n=1 Tax=Sphingomonas sp. CV7422 TaxID=3018036 RepID=UPI0022FE760C|nr:2-hydroxyacyl-CoA dehydratase family protein [Sphingomonas sp. CV7422]